MHQINLFFSTIVFRPYVFIFLAMYLVAATLKVGGKKALFFTLSAWAIAYVAEFSSIRNGIPFGLYHYIPSTVNCELWICGVPFMDSLSFTFLAYSSWSVARVFLCPAEGKGLGYRLVEGYHPPLPAKSATLSHEGRGNNEGDMESEGSMQQPEPPPGALRHPPPQVERVTGYRSRFSLGTVFLGALLFMLIDVVIDPLSLRGDRWFLGKVYYYPDGGAYFGVTISNFIGWFIVGFVTLAVWGVIDRYVKTPSPGVSRHPLPLQGEGNSTVGCAMRTEYAPTLPSGLPSPAGGEGNKGNVHVGARGIRRYIPSVDLMGPALYMIVLIFNLTMTFYIGEYTIGWVGVFIFLPVVFLMGKKIRG